MLQNHTFCPILGGIENYLYYVSKTLERMGHQPVILCEKHDEKLTDFDIYDGIPVIRHPYYKIPKPVLFMKPKLISRQLKHFIREHAGDIDLVISRYPQYCYATCLADLGVPTFYIPATVYWNYTKRSSEISDFKQKFFNLVWKPILDNMESKSIIMSRRVITLSRHISNSLAQYYNLDSERFFVNPPGVDLDRFKKSDSSKELRHEFDIQEDMVVVLYVGRLSIEKNVDRLIKSFSELKRKDIHLLIVGCGPERLRLEQLRNDLNMIDKVTFVGLRKDVERFYTMADIFVLPSKYEAFGQVILEAMAAGLACVAFKKVLPAYEVASEELIRDGLTGFCVDPYDLDEFREKLLYLIDNPNVRGKMGAEGRRICAREFTWEGHVRRLLDLLN
ncbi:MAG: glycosyltransferase family 4 protein [Promethearchaeota archaeon]